MGEKKYDVIVIGGGPAGMMAAGRAAFCGAKVLLLEKNSSLGKKLLITGGGRSNVTNAEFDQHIFLEKFKEAKKFLFSPLARFGVQDSLDFFEKRGMPTKVEAEKRVFPVSDSAQSVWDVLVGYMQKGGVTVRTEAEVIGFDTLAGQILAVRLRGGEKLEAKKYVLATGGKSRPETGSTGEGFQWLQRLGHTIINSRPSLVPVRVRERFVADLSGLSFSDIKLSFFHQGKKQESKRGKLLFTHVGLSGPLVLNMSKSMSEFLQYGDVAVQLDFFPEKNLGEIDKEVQAILDTQKNKQIKNSLDGLVAPRLVPILLELAGIESEKAVNGITREERLLLSRLLKEFPLTVTGLLGEDKAIVTSGGVALEEIDFKNMSSRLYPNLHIIGDVLNIDRPSGGYSLQLCWTTGFVAGSAAAGE